MAILFDCIAKWLAPVLCFTAEEAWLECHPGDESSVHLQLFPEIPAAWRDAALAKKWQAVRDLRRVVTGCLEHARAEKKIGSSLQAAPVIFVERMAELPDGISWDEIFITSGHRFADGAAPAEAFRLSEVPGIAALFEPAPGEKCQRCWKVLPEIGTHPHHKLLCIRCADAVDHLPAG